MMPPNESTEHPATGMSHQTATTHCWWTCPVKSQHRAGVQPAQTQPPPDTVRTRASLTPSRPFMPSHLFILVKTFLSLSCTGDPSWTDRRKPSDSSSPFLGLCWAVWTGETLWGTMNYPGFRISISCSDSISLSLAISVTHRHTCPCWDLAVPFHPWRSLNNLQLIPSAARGQHVHRISASNVFHSPFQGRHCRRPDNTSTNIQLFSINCRISFNSPDKN